MNSIVWKAIKLAAMRFLIVLALSAVAFAEEVRVVNPGASQYSQPDIRPLMVPQEVLDAVNVVEPVIQDAEKNAPFDDLMYAPDEGLEVHFVDSPLDTAFAGQIDPLGYVADGLEVHFVDSPLDTASAGPIDPLGYVADEGLEVHFVDSPLDTASAGPIDPLGYVADEGLEVNFVDSFNVAEDIVPEPITLGEAPLPAYETESVIVAAPEPIVLGEAPVPAFEEAPAVEAVKIATPQVAYPGKQYDDARLR